MDIKFLTTSFTLFQRHQRLLFPVGTTPIHIHTHSKSALPFVHSRLLWSETLFWDSNIKVKFDKNSSRTFLTGHRRVWIFYLQRYMSSKSQVPCSTRRSFQSVTKKSSPCLEHSDTETLVNKPNTVYRSDNKKTFKFRNRQTQNETSTVCQLDDVGFFQSDLLYPIWLVILNSFVPLFCCCL